MFSAATVCLFVSLFFTWRLGELYKSFTRVRIWGSYAPPLGPRTRNCGGLMSHYARNQQTDVGVVRKYANMRFRPGLHPGLRWGSLRHSPIPHRRRGTRFSRRQRSPLKFGASVWRGGQWGHFSQIISSRTARDGTPHFTNKLPLGTANMKPAPCGK